MKKIILLIVLFTSAFIFSQENKTYRVYFRDGTTRDVLNVSKLPTAINCLTLNSMNSLTFLEKDYYSYRPLNTQLPFFEFKDKKFTDYVVVSIDSLSQKKLFDRTLNWIKEKFKNPDKVIKMTIENEKIRIEGYKEDLYCIKDPLGIANTCGYGTYTIEISFKSGKYKFDPSYLEINYSNGVNKMQIPIDDFSYLYNDKGNLRKMYEYIPMTIDDLFNSLNSELYDYIMTSGKKDNW